MSLADRLRAAAENPGRSNSGCVSCQWFAGLNDDIKTLINDWYTAGHSTRQLYILLSAPDDDEPDYQPLPVSESGWRAHLRHHDRCR